MYRHTHLLHSWHAGWPVFMRKSATAFPCPKKAEGDVLALLDRLSLCRGLGRVGRLSVCPDFFKPSTGVSGKGRSVG